MKKLFAIILILSSTSIWACSCEKQEDSLTRLLINNHKVESNSVKVDTVRVWKNYLVLVPLHLASSNGNNTMDCGTICSTKGLRLVAQVEFVKNDKLCTADMIKPSYSEEKTILKRIECQ